MKFGPKSPNSSQEKEKIELPEYEKLSKMVENFKKYGVSSKSAPDYEDFGEENEIKNR